MARHAPKWAVGRFSRGIEQLPDTPEKRALGRFSRGIDHSFEPARQDAWAALTERGP